MEHLPEIISACDQLIVTCGDQAIRYIIFNNMVRLSCILATLVGLPIIGLSIWRFGVLKNWW